MTIKRRAAFDELAELVQRAIDLLETAGTIEKPDLREYDGYCARACAAYKYLVEQDTNARELSQYPNVRLKRLKEPGSGPGESHYWLEDYEGNVLDLTFNERRRLSRSIDYGAGKGASVLTDSDGLPKRKDTQRIIAVVQAALGD
ncbi:MAG: hypothetical protein M3356_07290 [Actinomycetota bacterium]|nr:hypothetical protein [Actinomycetota bacterium]